MDKRLGKYLILGKLGPGSMLLGEDDSGKKKVIKSYKLKSKRMFGVKDLDAFKKLEHQNILPPSDIQETPDSIYAVYTYDNADNLKDFIKKKGELQPKEFFLIIESLIDGYKALKNNNMIHANIKPQNILISYEKNLTPKLMLTDFPILLSYKRTKESIDYIAPEIISNDTKPNIMTDIWSIGAVINLMLKHTKLSSNIWTDLVKKCLKENPEERINFNVILVHPCFTLTPTIYKFCQGNLLINVIDYCYICTCKQEGDAILNCGDSFCMGCFAQLIWKYRHFYEFNECFKIINYLFFSTDNNDDSYIYNNCQSFYNIWNMKIKCPNCRLFSEIGNYIYSIEILKLRCGCFYNKNNDNVKFDTEEIIPLTYKGNFLIINSS